MLIVVVALSVFTGTRLANAAQRGAARVTQVVQDVKLLISQAPPKPATVSDNVAVGEAVRTGVASRVELTFDDQTITRLGANTVLTMNGGTRVLDLSGGTILLALPKNIGGAQVRTTAITAAITGTTIVLEYESDVYFKLLVLEGTARLFKTGDPNVFVLLHSGEMVTGKPNAPLDSPVAFSIREFMLRSILIRGFPLLPSASLILAEMRNQKEHGLPVNAPPLDDEGIGQHRVVSPYKPPGHE